MFSKNAQTVLAKRYLLRDDAGELAETIEQLFVRVACAIAAVESSWGASAKQVAEIEKRFYDSMIGQCFMPNSPTLMNAGKDRGQLSACFVLPVPDSLEGIFETCKNAALIHKTGGGTGFSFSRLRPVNDRVATTCGVASGPVSFMTVYDAATEAIRQGGTRRGANMGILNIDHPDIEQFINCKSHTDKLNNFNISVAVTEEFMEAVKQDRAFDLIHPRTRHVVKTLRARDLFEQIVRNAHATGEPGIVFMDRINKGDPIIQTLDDKGFPVPGTEDIEATNPCGEQPLGPGDACNLGSINVAKYVDEAKPDFAWAELAEMVELAVRFLDDVVQANCYPLNFIAQATLNNRRIGLGIMGWAEALIRLKIPYDTDAAVSKAEELMSFIRKTAHAASGQLAGQRGNFPNWPFSTWAKDGVPMRNATVTTIAPTGTISIIAGTTSGIEPVFAVSFMRRVLGGMELVEVDALFEQTARERGFYSQELMRQIADEGTIQHVEGIPPDVKRLWVCSHDINFIWHVKMQQAFQKFTDCAVSKTINLPRQSSVDDVAEIYQKAYELGLKGITVYRDTSREKQVLNLAATAHQKKDQSAERSGTVISPLTKRGSRVSRTTAIKLSLQGEGKFSYSNLLSRDPTSRGSRGLRLCPECGLNGGHMLVFEACSRCCSCGYTRC